MWVITLPLGRPCVALCWRACVRLGEWLVLLLLLLLKWLFVGESKDATLWCWCLSAWLR